jgi:hypothetical protein
MATEITIITARGNSGDGPAAQAHAQSIYPPPAGTPFLKRVLIRVVAGLILLASIAGIVLVFAIALPIALAIVIALGLFVLLIVGIALGRGFLQRMGVLKAPAGFEFRVQRDQRENVRVRRNTTAGDVIDPPQ